jgi:hypothetical protein
MMTDDGFWLFWIAFAVYALGWGALPLMILLVGCAVYWRIDRRGKSGAH